MDKIKTRIAIIISCVCLIFILIHFFWPQILIDNNILILIAIGCLPWLTLFFKKITIPGVLEVEADDRVQSTTTKLIPPKLVKHLDSSQIDLTPEALKILATLWKYQKLYFKDNISKRWTFAVLPNAKRYLTYLAGVLVLSNSGLITICPENSHLLLTNEGLAYIQQHPEIQTYSEVYQF